MGELSKQVFKHYAEFECDRQLLLDLGQDDAAWLSPLRALIEPDWNTASARSGLAELGRAYERSVYDLLCKNPRARYKHSFSADAPIVASPLDAAALSSLHAALAAPGGPPELYLLEHQFPTPSRFIEFVFGLPPGAPPPVSTPPGSLRPDILVVGNAGDASAADPVAEVLPDGSLRPVPAAERAGRFGISVLDIKHAHEQGVGRGHLIELLYYALSLSAHLDALGARDRFFVRAEGHGIFPKRDLTALAGLLVGTPRELIVPLCWRDTYHLFEAVQRRVQHLRAAAPTPIEAIPARIQAACGRCQYLEDCKRTHQRGASPADWDLGLIPYLRPGSAEQLRALGLHSVGDVATKARHIPIGATPQPIYAEIAPLELKAKALVEGIELPATAENTAGQRMLSLALPRYTNVDLLFDLETDPTNEVVFALGLYLSIDAGDKAPFYAQHVGWWTFWRAALSHKGEPDWSALEARLDPALFGPFVSGEPEVRRRTYRQFYTSLRRLADSPGGELRILLPGESRGAFTASSAHVSYEFTYVNSGAQGARGYQDGERIVAERAVSQLFDILMVSGIYEDYVRVVQSETKPNGNVVSWTLGPGFAGFFWSREQLEHVQDLLERHLPRLVGQPQLRDQFLALLEWLAPSESGVAHYLQHRKIFNLREFVEGTVGIPEIINVTWHGIDTRLDATGKTHYSRRYWAPHFNYMDFAVWHECIDEPDANRQVELRQGIAREVRRKLWALQRILRHYRRTAGDLIARSRKAPAATNQLRQTTLTNRTHPLGQVWYLYSRLNAAVQDLDAEYIRTTYPSQSIAALEAAEATDLVADPATLTISLRIGGLSSNAKFAEGDYVLLLPEGARDAVGFTLTEHQVIVDEMAWDPPTQSFRMVLGRSPRSVHPLFDENASPADAQWFLYPMTSDAWSDRLLSLLKRKAIGESWLGRRLSLLWSVGSDTQLPKPDSPMVGAPEVYLFAPDLLPRREPLELPLRSTQHPPPDPSQTEAIRFALSSTVSCIQGPPGTGKSQTIAALVDEFLLRREGPARVLVTAFSYAALGVVLDKLRRATDKDGRPTRAAKTQLVWLRSSGREPIPDEDGLGHVYDLTLPSKNSMELDGVLLKRHGGKRLESYLEPSFILFANAYSLAKLSTPSEAAKFEYELLLNGFGFDLVIVDEASQLPANQLLASAALVRPFSSAVRFTGGEPDPWPSDDREKLAAIALDPAPAFDEVTRYVIVGDHNQLPPVQPVKPPAKLQRALDSAFHYFVLGHGVPHRQLRRNYRSHPAIVDYTRRLELYEAGLEAFRAEYPFEPLPPPPADEPAWLQRVLADAAVVGALVHQRQHETAVSPLEAKLAADLAVAFLRQLQVGSAAAEREFWQEHLGVVAPHNAQGRLIARQIYDRLTQSSGRLTQLDDRELVQCLRSTIYSVEKFQGSDRTFIIGSVALSSRDQLAMEEAFIYDLNRFNVLTSRAKQKMLLLCSQSFLDYIPRDRDVFAYSARVRQFVYGYCDREEAVEVVNEQGQLESPAVLWRHRAG